MNRLHTEHSRITACEKVSGAWDALTDLPEFDRVAFESSFGAGSFIRTELWLPAEWNGVFVALGNGGMAGSLHRPGFVPYIQKGYAVAQTDMGTSRGRDAGIANKDMWADFGWRATHEMAAFSKAVIAERYGKAPDFSYFIGSSTGGQQALGEAQRFPEDFDGIIAGVPANNRVFLHTYFLWNHNHLRRRDGSVLFTPEEVAAITQYAAQHFRQLGDGQPGDNFVTLPHRDENTVDDFLAGLHQAQPHFTQEQLSALRAVYDGPKNPVTGKRIYNGMPIGSELFGCGILDCQAEESPHYYPFIWTFGEGYDPYAFDFDEDLQAVSNALSGDLNANDADLSAFAQAGGKLIAYSGSADPCVPFPDAMQYAQRVADSCGGYAASSAFFRYFLMPGKDHGGTGLGATHLFGSEERDLLDTLRLWREKGRAPDRLIAARLEQDKLVFERSIYPYLSPRFPQTAFPPACDEAYLND